jgi:hypothetical protein
MTKKRKAPEDVPREMPFAYWLGQLRSFEAEELSAIAAGAGPEALARMASLLSYALVSISKLSFDELRAAAPALSEVERFLTHPGRYVEPAHTIYWDWTMDENCAQEVPAVEMTVAEAAAQAVAAIRQCLPADSSHGAG